MRFHQVVTVPTAPFDLKSTSMLRSAQCFRYSNVIECYGLGIPSFYVHFRSTSAKLHVPHHSL